MNKLLFLLLIFVSLFATACTSSQPSEENIGIQIIPPQPEVMQEEMIIDDVHTTPSDSVAVVEETSESIPSSDSSSVTASIEGFSFSPQRITIKKGTTITWTNKDKVRHNVAFDSGKETGPLLAQGESYSFTFTESGTYPYHCTPHPNMKGTVIVE